jgi:hypothetical protein
MYADLLSEKITDIVTADTKLGSQVYTNAFTLVQKLSDKSYAIHQCEWSSQQQSDYKKRRTIRKRPRAYTVSVIYK